MHEQRVELIWVDILGCQLHRGTLAPDGSLDQLVTISIDRHVGAVAPAEGGGYVLAAGTGFMFVDEDGSVRELAQPEAGRTDGPATHSPPLPDRHHETPRPIRSESHRGTAPGAHRATCEPCGPLRHPLPHVPSGR